MKPSTNSTKKLLRRRYHRFRLSKLDADPHYALDVLVTKTLGQRFYRLRP